MWLGLLALDEASPVSELAVRLRAGDHPDAGSGRLPPEPLYLRRPDAVESAR